MAQPHDAIVDFSSLYAKMVGAARPFVGSLLTGHLAIEFLLRQLVRQYDSRLGEHAQGLRHHALIALNYQLGSIDESQRDVLNAINKFRNKLAHQISFDPSIEELRALWQQASCAFSDLTDGISQGIEALQTVTTGAEVEEWIWSELFVQICYDLHGEYVERGGDEESF